MQWSCTLQGMHNLLLQQHRLGTLRQHTLFWVRACPSVGLASVFDLGLAKKFVCGMY